MLRATLLIPFLLLASLIRVQRYPWKVLLLLLIVGPFIASGLLIAGGVAFTDVGASPSSLRDWISFILTAYLFVLPMAVIYPRSACVAILALVGWVICERLWLRSRDRTWRIFVGVALGTAAGTLFSLVIFLAYQNSAFVDFVSAGDVTSRGLPPFAVPMSIITGVVDGALVALFNQNARAADDASPL
jgi:hypothetical protein